MHPILIQIGSFFIGTYGLMIMIGLLAAMGLGLRLARRVGIKGEQIYDLAFFAAISGIVGGRIGYILVELPDLMRSSDPMREFGGLIFSRFGFVFLGGFAAAIVTLIFYIRKKKLAMWDVGDVGAPSLALGHAFGRIGCFAAGCCYGRVVPVGSFWSFLGVRFPRVFDREGNDLFSMAYLDHHKHGLVDATAICSLPVFPTQLIESAANFLICLVLVFLWSKRKFSGQIFCYYLFFYGAARFLIEFLRGDAERGVYFGISTSQFLSLIAIGAGIVIWKMRRSALPVTRKPVLKATNAR